MSGSESVDKAEAQVHREEATLAAVIRADRVYECSGFVEADLSFIQATPASGPDREQAERRLRSWTRRLRWAVCDLSDAVEVMTDALRDEEGVASQEASR